MNNTYPLKRLCDVGVSLLDCEHKTPKPNVFGYPYIAIPNIQNGRLDLTNVRRISKEDYLKWTKKIKPQSGDVILTRRARVGDTAVVPAGLECAIGQNLVLLRSDGKQLSQKYLRWVLRSPQYWVQVEKYLNRGAVFDSLNCRDILLFEIPVPPMEIQKKIAAILSSLDDKIEINTRMNKVLEETARALFHRWFVEFEFPNDEGKPYKSSGGRMIASEMGEIPEGWTIKRAQEICNISIGKTPPRKETQWFTSNSSDVKWISISDMGSSGMFVLDSSEYLTVDAIEKFNIVTVPKDTVILSFKLTIGRVSITSEDLVTNEAIAHFKTNIQELREYLYFTLKCYDYVSLGSTSSIATAINSKIIKNMNILLPHINLIKDYHALVLPIFEIIRTNQTEINQLKKIRETILPKLMGGGIIS